MHLLMTTYRQDVMTNFGCVRDRSTFRAVFQNMHKRTKFLKSFKF